MSWRRPPLFALWLAACSAGPPPDVAITAAASWPEADLLFHRGSPAFLGADAAYSIDLRDGRVLWLFGDTFVATTAANVRTESEMVRNAVAIQTGLDPLTASFEPAWRVDRDGTPASYFPEDGARWHWPGHGVRIPDGPLVVFLSILRATPGQGLGFAGDGWRLAIVDEPSGPPSSWSVRFVDPPAQSLDAVIGAAVAVDGDEILALAAAEAGSHATYLVRFARAALTSGDLSGITFVGPLFDEAATEASLHFDAALGFWIYIYSRGFGGTTLAMRTALVPEGPWSDTADIFTPPESRGDDPFVYAGKAHPELVAGGELAITYATNSFDFGDLFTPNGMNDLYWPRFVRVTATTVADE